jgi:hypothetical protein
VFEKSFDFNKIKQVEDSNGNTMLQLLASGAMMFDTDSLPDENAQSVILGNIGKFNYSTQYTHESETKLGQIMDYLYYFTTLNQCVIPSDYSVGENAPLLKSGTKVSRAFNAVCTHYGIDKFDPQTKTIVRDGQVIEKTVYPYDKLFAEYSDLVSCLKRKMNFIISLNPLDYLTMSDGINWHSCHSIRGGGGWKNGCLSYMLDTTSIITFVINEEDRPIHEIPKVYRQMYHYENDLFIQNRLYPQGNDGATNLYDKFRGFMIEEFSELLGVEEEWKAESGAGNCSSHINSRGCHYTDYTSRNDCSIFYPVSKENQITKQMMTVGHGGVCIKCGRLQNSSNRVNHRFGSDCSSAEEVIF